MIVIGRTSQKDEMKPLEKLEVKTEELALEQSMKMSPKMSGYEGDRDEDEDEFPDDSFHMVTQYNWEEDIIWNGDDIKHKVTFKQPEV